MFFWDEDAKRLLRVEDQVQTTNIILVQLQGKYNKMLDSIEALDEKLDNLLAHVEWKSEIKKEKEVEKPKEKKLIRKKISKKNTIE